jgi:hypothetical protein
MSFFQNQNALTRKDIIREDRSERNSKSDKENTSPEKEDGRKSIFAALFSKGKPHKTYRSDLKHKW